MAYWTKFAVVLITAFVTLEGLIVVLWPEKIRDWLRDAPPNQLRVIASFELFLGIIIFLYLVRTI